ncbi:MAG TPA: choice-of-anchor A family protein [Cellvibrio sp.]|nr:choice-of-anchor A family protein [Cellvibrio sp.]
MSINVFKKIALLGFMAASTSVFAGPLNDYNLILSGDFGVSGGSGHVHGKTFIGGNLNGMNPEFAQDAIYKSLTTDTLEVVGDLNANMLKVNGGALGYGGTNNVGTINCNGTPFGGSAACVHQVSGLDAKKTNLFNQLTAESNYYKSLVSTGVVNNSDLNQSKFIYGGLATDLAVFNLSGSTLFSSHGWDIDFGNAQKVVINVSGTNLNGLGSFNFLGNFGASANYSNILWNFYEAENTLDLGNRWAGSVLALNAAVDINNDIDGSLAAKSYIGDGQIHDYHWSYTPPKTNVPEPSSLLLSLFGLGLVLLGRARRQK